MDLKILIIEEIGGIFSASFVGDDVEKNDAEGVVLEYSDDENEETVELLKRLIQFHGEENGSLCEELEKIMNFVLNEGIKIGKSGIITDLSVDQKERKRKKIIDLLKKADPNKVAANELNSIQRKIERLAEQFQHTYHEFPIPKDECPDPNFADIDYECYNYCMLCGQSWDR